MKKSILKKFLILLLCGTITCFTGCGKDLEQSIDKAVLKGNQYTTSTTLIYKQTTEKMIRSEPYIFRQFNVSSGELIAHSETDMTFVYSQDKKRFVGIKINTINKDSDAYFGAKFSLFEICCNLPFFPQEQVAQLLNGVKKDLQIGNYYTMEITNDYNKQKAIFWIIHEDYKDWVNDF